jgi:hypothetical protein
VGECARLGRDHPHVTGILLVAELATAGAIFGNRFAIIVVGLALRQQEDVFMASGRPIADTLREMAGFMPNYVASEIPAIGAERESEHPRDANQVFVLQITAQTRRPVLALAVFE